MTHPASNSSELPTHAPDKIGLSWNGRMTLSLVDMTNEFLSFANVMLLVGCRFDAVNSDMTIGGDVGEARGDAKYRV